MAEEPTMAEEPPADEDDVRALTRSVDALAGEVRGIREDMHGERRRYNKRLLLICVVVGIGLLGLAGIGLRERDIRRISNQRAQDLADSRVAACRQYNVQQQRAREASVQIATSAVITGLTQLASDPAHLTPEEMQIRSRVVAQVTAAAGATATAQYPFRDCSAEGIRRFLEHPPPDPNEVAPTTAAKP